MADSPLHAPPEVSVQLRDDGVLEFDYLTNRVVDLALAQRAVAEANGLVQGPTPTLVRINQVKEVTREARVFFAESEENRRVSSKVALLIASPLGRIIGNFFMGLNRATLPVRLFTEVDAAVDWLRG